MPPSSEDELAREQAIVQQQIDAARARIEQAAIGATRAEGQLTTAHAQEAVSQQRITDLKAELRAAHTAALGISETLATQMQQQKINQLEHSLTQARKQHKIAEEASARIFTAAQAVHHETEKTTSQANLLLNKLDARLERLQDQRALAHAQIGRTKLAELKAALAARVLAVEEAQMLLDEATLALDRLQRSAADLLIEWPELQEEVQRLLSEPSQPTDLHPQ